MNNLKYKGFVGTLEYDKYDGIYYGKILNINDVVNYEGISMGQTKKAFIKAVDDYILFCKDIGKGMIK